MKIFQVGTLSIFQFVRLIVIIFLARAFHFTAFQMLIIQGSIATLDVIFAVFAFSLIVVIPILTILTSAFEHWYREFVIALTSPPEYSLQQELIPIILNSLLMCLLNFKIFVVAFLLSGLGVAVLRLNSTVHTKMATLLLSLRPLRWAKRFLRLLTYMFWATPLLCINVSLFMRQEMKISTVIVLWNLYLLILPPLYRFTLTNRNA